MTFQVMDVARYIVNYYTEQNKPVSNKKKKKMLYYIWIEYHRRTNEYLFEDNIYAWPFGPVVPDVYYEYCSYAGSPIAKNYDLKNIFGEDDSIELNNIIEQFIDTSPNDLVNRSHQPNMPWDRIYQNGAGYRDVIPFDLIIELEH